MPTLADPRMSSLLLDQNYRHTSYVIVQPKARGPPTIDRIPGPSKSRLVRSVLLRSSASSLARLHFVQQSQWRALFLLIVRIGCLRPLCSVLVHHEDLHRSTGQGKGVRLGEEVVVIVVKLMIETSTETKTAYVSARESQGIEKHIVKAKSERKSIPSLQHPALLSQAALPPSSQALPHVLVTSLIHAEQIFQPVRSRIVR